MKMTHEKDFSEQNYSAIQKLCTYTNLVADLD